MEKERKARQAKMGKEREEVRQKIRDKVSSIEVSCISKKVFFLCLFS
jgi:hypothetical protein